MIGPSPTEIKSMSDVDLAAWYAEFYGDAAPWLVDVARGRVQLDEELRSNPHGYNQYTGAGAGGDDPSSLPGVKAGAGTKDDPYVVTDMNSALKLLADDKVIHIDHEGKPGILLDKLKALGDKAKADGVKAQRINLCNVTTPNGSLFCAENKNIPRQRMPQLTGVPEKGTPADRMPKDAKGEVNLGPAFLEKLSSQGIASEHTTMPADQLHASQNFLDGVKVAWMMAAMEAGTMKEGAISVSRDGYVVDGHHRWAATVATQYHGAVAPTMSVVKYDVDIMSALAKANVFTHGMGIASSRSLPSPPCIGCEDQYSYRANPHGWNQWTGGQGSGKAVNTDPKAGNTQMTRSSVSAPTKVFLERGMIKGDVLHHGAGKAQADTELMRAAPAVKSVTEFDPFPNPKLGQDYVDKTSDTRLLGRQYDTVVSNYVLNVLPQGPRDAVLAEISATTKPGGSALISVRPASTEGGIKTGVKEGDGTRVTSSKGTFQKGFSPAELKAYAETKFGTVEIVKGIDSAVVATNPFQSRTLDTAVYISTDRPIPDGPSYRSNPEGFNQWTGPGGGGSDTEPTMKGTRLPEGPGVRKGGSLYPLASQIKTMSIAADLKREGLGPEERQIAAKSLATFESVLGVTPEQAQANIVASFDRAIDSGKLEEYVGWYNEAHDIATNLADQNGLEPAIGVAVLAACSPGCEYEVNKAWAESIMDAVANRGDETIGDRANLDTTTKKGESTTWLDRANGVLGGSKGHPGELITADLPFRQMSDRQLAVVLGREGGTSESRHATTSYDGQAKGIALARSNDIGRIDEILNGAKVRSFYNNLDEPNRDGDFTADRHMFRAIMAGSMTADTLDPKVLDTLLEYDRPKSGAVTLLTGTPGFAGADIGGYPVAAEVGRAAMQEINERVVMVDGVATRPYAELTVNQVQAVSWGQWRDIDWPVIQAAMAVRKAEVGA